LDDQNDKEKLSVELVTRIQQGDQQAEHQLIKRYSARIDMILRRHCHDATQVSDLRQEVFIAALKKLRKEGLKQPAQLSAFLHRIALNMANYETRRHYRRKTEPDWAFIEQQVDQNPSLLERLQQAEVATVIHRLLGELKVPRDQQILRRFYLSEESKGDICLALDVTQEHFDRVLYRARKRFKDLLIKRTGDTIWPPD
jgi:RNA polymerase sigma-70 factor (ECF subfamily)